MNKDKLTAEDFLSHLLEQVNRETEVGRKYAKALDVEELTYMVAEQICIAAASIMFAFKHPKRGRLVLKLMKKTIPSAYAEYQDRNNGLFAQCSLFVVNRMKEHMDRFHPEIVLYQKDYDQLAVWAGVEYYSLIKMEEDDIETFKKHMAEAISMHNYDEPDPITNQLNRIIAANGKKPSPAEIAEITKEALLNDPLRIIEPLQFFRNYQRLAAI